MGLHGLAPGHRGSLHTALGFRKEGECWVENDAEVNMALRPYSVMRGPLEMQGVISAGTLHRVANLRGQGVKFVVITGARLSTLLMRLPYLPFCDALVCESGRDHPSGMQPHDFGVNSINSWSAFHPTGGRIFYPGCHLPTACPMQEDEIWRAMQEAAGPVDQVRLGSKHGIMVDVLGIIW